MSDGSIGSIEQSDFHEVNHRRVGLHTSLNELNPACNEVIFSPSDNSLSDGKYASPIDASDPSDNLTYMRLGQSSGGRMRTSLIELNLACYDVIFSPSDNSLSDGKHACPMDPSDHYYYYYFYSCLKISTIANN